MNDQEQLEIAESIAEFELDVKDASLEQWCITFIAWAITEHKFSNLNKNGVHLWKDTSYVTNILKSKFQEAENKKIGEIIEKIKEQKISISNPDFNVVGDMVKDLIIKSLSNSHEAIKNTNN